uniref:Uncharacterized protein n=1 Tax=Timema monikensis TaxID=170555 RepID=A0A7R9EBK2_9NEOP|nr:unnamed protein product [Timema monikensis]
MMQGIGDPTGIPNSKTDATPTTMEGTAPITVLISDYPNNSLEVRSKMVLTGPTHMTPRMIICILNRAGLSLSWGRKTGSLWHRYPGRVAGLANARINHCVSERILEDQVKFEGFSLTERTSRRIRPTLASDRQFCGGSYSTSLDDVNAGCKISSPVGGQIYLGSWLRGELFGEAYGSQEEKKLEDELDRLRSYRDTLAGGTLDWREASTYLQGAVELLDRAVQVCKQLASQCWDLFLAPMMDSLNEECSVLRGKRTTKLPFLVHFTLVQSECRVALLTHWISLDPLASLGFQVPASLAGYYCEQIRITSVITGYFRKSPHSHRFLANRRSLYASDERLFNKFEKES